MLLVHAQAPKIVLDTCSMKIKHDTIEVNSSVWTRRDTEGLLREIQNFLGLSRIGLDGYFTIVGHTPVQGEGFELNLLENYINIDGGCAGYALGFKEFSHVPLLEVKEKGFRILLFNHHNEIEKGYYFDGYFTPLKEHELNHERCFLNSYYWEKDKGHQKTIGSKKSEK